MKDLISDRTRVRNLSDWVGLLMRNPPGEPGPFRYSDINFVILANITVMLPVFPLPILFALFSYHHISFDRTAVSDRREIPGRVPGYAGPGNFFGGDSMIESGKLIYNPQFESGGGGYVSNAPDLARWITLFATSTISPRLLDRSIDRNE